MYVSNLLEFVLPSTDDIGLHAFFDFSDRNFHFFLNFHERPKGFDEFIRVRVHHVDLDASWVGVFNGDLVGL